MQKLKAGGGGGRIIRGQEGVSESDKYLHLIQLGQRLSSRSGHAGAHNPKGRSVELVIPPVVEWHLQENSIYGMPSGYAWLVYYTTSAM